jgi:hypothetical protein
VQIVLCAFCIGKMQRLPADLQRQVDLLRNVEPIIITRPAFLINLVAAVQLFVLGRYLDAWAAANPGAVDPWRWTGFLVFLPAFAQGWLDFYRMSFYDTRQVTEMAALRGRLPSDPAIPTVPGIPNTEAEYGLEAAKCKSLLNKRVAWWVTLWAVILKMTFDNEGECTWTLALLPMMLFFGYFAAIGWFGGNMVGTDERVLAVRDAVRAQERGEAEAEMQVLVGGV